jgi:hypothetical protein
MENKNPGSPDSAPLPLRVTAHECTRADLLAKVGGEIEGVIGTLEMVSSFTGMEVPAELVAALRAFDASTETATFSAVIGDRAWSLKVKP